MRKNACYFAGVVTATAGLLLTAVPASADGTQNDGVNGGNDDNVNVAPIQLCNSSVAVVGAVADGLSPDGSGCKPEDKPKPEKPKPEKPKPPKPEKPHAPAPPPVPAPGPAPGPAPAPAPAPEQAPEQAPQQQAPAQEAVSPAELPAAPSPVAVAGHAAVTG
ncbi:hypothetical protein INP57_01580 [Saccharopolyspora sp. HNM0986]|uniref:hypothetical protein n=1 Tax=Saccharopolyspora galaxeae TaxID=2781241 RepID=UPI00190D03C8|nr:hypothetical protein [Saccharopolyspora sp. HNM0986]MBK0865494.1 hypothetical protein [Saccharopolyspora sp. HNM0986]